MGKKVTTEDFIEKAKNIHGELYDYRYTRYYNAKTPVKIGCDKHGVFEQLPMVHLRGCGCQKCGIEKVKNELTKTTEDFIFEARNIHKDKYDYSETEYVNSITKIKIICPVHGIFYQTPQNHLSGQGCIKCGIEKIHDLCSTPLDIFINTAKEIHNNMYDYSLVSYNCLRDKVKIICPIHGIFEQVAFKHLHGAKCKKCADAKRGLDKRKQQGAFIAEAIKIHNNKYDYSQVCYQTCKIPIKIICSEHGEFVQLPDYHLRGAGCPKCKLKSQTKLLMKIKQVFPNNFDDWEYSPDWLGQQRIDIADSNLNIGIEYDGEQHFKPISVYGGEEEYLKRINLDKQKDELCKEHNFTLFRLKYDYSDEDFKNVCDCIKDLITAIKDGK